MKMLLTVLLAVLLSAPLVVAQSPPATVLPAQPELVAADVGGIVVLRGAPRADKKWPAPLPAGASLELVAPRGGQASAQAILRAARLANVTATVSALQGPGGATLPASALQIRWLTGERFADKFAAKPVEPQVQPLLLTVSVPAATAPGIYTGRLAVTADGFNGGLAVKLEVTPWLLPAPAERRYLTGLIHSPDTVALQYNVEPWSDEHLRLLEPSLRLLKELGSESCWLHLIAEGIMYERYSIVRWRNGIPDFTCVDKYLDLWQRICGPPKKMTLYVWDNGSHPAKGNQASYTPEKSVKVTRIGPDGVLTNVAAPYYSTPEATAFWKPVFDGIKERIAKRGWKNTEILLGMQMDVAMQEEAVEMLQKITGGLRWRVYTHGFNIPLPRADGKLVLPSGVEVGWIDVVAPIGFRPMAEEQPAMLRSAKMKRAYPFTVGPREQLQDTSEGWVWRDAPAAMIPGGTEGLSQVGLDYWPLKFTGRNRPPNLGLDVLVQLGPGGFNPRGDLINSVTVPGPNGAEPTLRYVLLREGLQAAEALLRVQQAGAAPPFLDFLNSRMENTFGVIKDGKIIDQQPTTYLRHIYGPGQVDQAIVQMRQKHPNQRVVIVASISGKSVKAGETAATGTAAGKADAVVIADYPRPLENFDEVAPKLKAAVPAVVPSEILKDRSKAVQRARVLAGPTGVVLVVGYGMTPETFDSQLPYQERSQTRLNAAVRGLYQAAAAGR